MKRLQRIEELPAADQRAVLKLVDAMIVTSLCEMPSAPTERAVPTGLVQTL